MRAPWKVVCPHRLPFLDAFHWMKEIGENNMRNFVRITNPFDEKIHIGGDGVVRAIKIADTRVVARNLPRP